MKIKPLIYVFDTNIFLTGIDFNIIEGIIYTTPSIIEEIKISKYINRNRNILNKINAAIETRKLRIKSPKSKFIDKIIEVSKKTGDFNALSDADKELIALTFELIENKNEFVKIYSNDYSIENVCSDLKIPFSSLYKAGIESKIIWEIYCPHCKNIHSAEHLNKICEICGSKLKRRPKNNLIY
ncbi:MAG: NOB1 family endonuclease [Candidatus Hodarchaeota archaeon]